MNFDTFGVKFEENKNMTQEGSLGITEFRSDTNKALLHFGKEIIQNSLDAKQEESDKPVRLTFRYMSNSDLSEEACNELLRLKTELIRSGQPKTIQALEDDDLKPSCLIIHDEGTVGLTGSFDKNSFMENRKLYGTLHSGERGLTEEDKKKLDGQNYLSLTRSSGVSYKGDNKLGSRGVGKWTLCYASKLNTFLFITKRKDDNKTLLGGVTRLEHHFYHNEKQYMSLGNWGKYSGDDWGMDGMSPILDESMVDKYQKLFNINRSEYGTTIIIPFLEDQYDDVSKILYKNIESFYRSILRKDLEVAHINCRDSRNKKDTDRLGSVSYDDKNLSKFLEEQGSNVIKKFFTFDEKHQDNMKNGPDITLKDSACDNEMLDKDDF